LRPQGYEVGAELYRNERHIVSRGRRLSDGAPVLIKGHRDFPCRPADGESLRREHTLLAGLRMPGVPRALELVRSDRGLWLVFDTMTGLPLASPPPGPLDLDSFFDLAPVLASIVGALHRADVIHKH
jgi:hypothetical protein